MAAEHDRLRRRGPARRPRGRAAQRAPRAAASSSPPTACRSPSCAARRPPGTLMFLPADRVIARHASATPPLQVAELQRRRARLPAARAPGDGAADPRGRDEAAYTEAELESAQMLHVARDAGISDEERARPAARARPRARPGGRKPARAAAASSCCSRGSASTTSPTATRELAAQLVSAARPAARATCSRCTCATPPQSEVDQRDRAPRRAAAGLARGGGLLRRPRRLHAARRGSAARRARTRSRCASKRSPPTSPSRRCGSSRRSATPRCSPRPSRDPLLDAALALIDAADAEGERLSRSCARGAAARAGAAARRRLVRAARSTSPAASPAIARPGSLLAERELHDSAPDGLPLVVRRRAAAARDPRARDAVPRSAPRPARA